MDSKVFNSIVNNRIRRIKTVLATKAKEYAREDRLHNFKRAGVIAGLTPEAALMGMFLKHIVSILDMVDTIEAQPQSLGTWDEKIGDAINYLILLEALTFERLVSSRTLEEKENA